MERISHSCLAYAGGVFAGTLPPSGIQSRGLALVAQEVTEDPGGEFLELNALAKSSLSSSLRSPLSEMLHPDVQKIVRKPAHK